MRSNDGFMVWIVERRTLFDKELVGISQTRGLQFLIATIRYLYHTSSHG